MAACRSNVRNRWVATRRSLALVAAIGTAAALMAGSSRPASAQSGKAQADLEVLTKAAKAEGELVFYSAATANVARRAADAFSAKYGIKTSFTRLSGVPLLQRYATEAQTGNFGADLMLNASDAVSFTTEGIAKGWTQSLTDAHLPVVESGEFPAKFNRGVTAIVQIGPWLIFYNTDKVKGADIPKDWPDLLDSKWKGSLLLADPKTSDAYIDLWVMLLGKYGEPFFSQLRGQNMRIYPGGPATIQALAAGEGAVAVPTIEAAVRETKDKGGPLDTITPDYTTGVEMQVILTAPAHSRRPNAARLFANYIMTEEGNKVLNSDPGAMTMYDTAHLPKQYESPRPGVLEKKEKIYELLGAR